MNDLIDGRRIKKFVKYGQKANVWGRTSFTSTTRTPNFRVKYTRAVLQVIILQDRGEPGFS